MLINLTNHPSKDWDVRQLDTAMRDFDKVVDLAFPTVPPEADKEEIRKLAVEYTEKIMALAPREKDVVHIMGELTFAVRLIELLKEKKIKCVASTTKRDSSMNDAGNKESRFVFVQFREY